VSGVPFFCLIFFAVEITLLSLTELGYFGSFFFGLDVVGTLSIILDISWLLKAVNCRRNFRLFIIRYMSYIAPAFLIRYVNRLLVTSGNFNR
jgi:hypothetical protein